MEKKRVGEDLFLREKPAKILLGIKTAQGSVYPTILSREANCTYSHTIKILEMFRKMGIVKFEKTGRIKKVTLTDDGWDLAHSVEALVKKYSQLLDSAKEREEKTVKKKPASQQKKE